MDPFEILEDAIKHLDFAPTTLEDQQQVEGALAAVKARVAELEAALRQIKHLAAHAPGAGQASTLELIERFVDKALQP